MCASSSTRSTRLPSVATSADVLITVDNGIASVEGVARANALGMRVLITDHHLPGERLPPADALVTGAGGGRNVMIMLTDYSNGNDMIIGKPGIKSLKDLKGKKVAVEFGLVEHLLLLNGLKKAGMKESDVTLVNAKTNEMPQVLASGDVAAVGAWQPIAGQAIRGLPGSRPIYTSADEPGLIYDVLAVNPTSLAARKADWQKVVGMWDKVVSFINDPKTQPEALKIMAARVGVKPEAYATFLKGTRLLSLKEGKAIMVKADGSLGERNPIFCGALEHKMGIHGNATAQINIDGAIGTLVGQPNKGLQAMFVMMNAARLGVGNQSLGLTEVAYQNALAYAKDRLQMRSLSGTKAKDKPADPIIVHPDVRRMLLTAKAYAEGGRALVTYCAFLIDKEFNHPDEKVRKDSAELVALLTPIVKAFITDNGWTATTMSQQVYGGHGFITEWGMEQFVRDARINMIYEGTNGIQALDLLGRKVLGNQGASLKKFGKLVAQLVEEEGVNEKMAEFINPIAYLGDQMTKFTTEIGFKGMQNPDEVGAASVDYLRVAGHLVFGYFFARMAQVALREIAKGNTDPFYQAKLQTARFYFAKLFPETATLMRTARAGSKVLMDTDAALA